MFLESWDEAGIPGEALAEIQNLELLRQTYSTTVLHHDDVFHVTFYQYNIML